MLKNAISRTRLLPIRFLSTLTKLPEIPLTHGGGAAYDKDLRSTSGLGIGDGITNHTEKWLQVIIPHTPFLFTLPQGDDKSPVEYVNEVEPIKVHGLVAVSHGDEDPGLGCPVEYIDLRGTSYEKPAVCKYTGYRFYSDDWVSGGAAH